MKKTLSMFIGVLMGASALTAAVPMWVDMATPGPDTYADGTPVLVGESYLLVHVAKDKEFGGLFMDGTLVDSKNNTIVFRWQTEAAGRCSLIPVQYAADKYVDGSWVIVVLDTRKVDGTVGGVMVAQGATVKTGVASQASPSSGTVLNAAPASPAGGAASLAAAGQVYVDALTPSPVITAVEPAGSTVNLRFKNIADNVSYKVESTADLSSGQWQTVAERIDKKTGTVLMGAGGVEELKSSINVSGNNNVRFFRVMGPPVATAVK